MKSPAHTLDPTDWGALRASGHRMLDDMLDYLQNIRERPAWQPIPESERERFRESLPQEPTPLDKVHASFMRHILPYVAGNAHPGFMGWVQGGGTPVGMLAEMLCAGLNANVGGRDQMPIEVEKQVTRWVRELMGFPATASGLFVTGSSAANLIAVLVARYAAGGPAIRSGGVAASGNRFAAYASSAAHQCIARALDFAGLGAGSLHVVPTNSRHQMDIEALKRRIAADRADGFTPFFIAATAGTVDTGAVDDLGSTAAVAEQERVWFHVDGAYGAFAMLAPDLAPLLAGIERADSVALDFHKWGQVPYDAGFVLVRDGALHQAAFASRAAYLSRESRGLAGGSPWPCDLGPDLSRSFRALKTWFTIKVYGAAELGRMISGTCAVARYLAERIQAYPALELLAPVALNVVCFRFRCRSSDIVNRNIVIALQESGIAAPSTTRVNGSLAIRAAIVNHRTGCEDADALLEATLRLGKALAGDTAGPNEDHDTHTRATRPRRADRPCASV